MGRVAKRTQKIDSGAGELTRATTQSYVLNGLVNDIEYPTSTVAVPRRVSYENWPNGQVKGVWQGAVGTGSSYIAVDGYWGIGAERKSTLGNGVVEATSVNERMQMTGRSWTQGGTTLLGLGLAWGTSQNNGNLVTQTMTGLRGGVPLNFQQDYEYDALNRLQLVKDNGVVNCGSASWRQKYIYDRYGNRALRQGSCPGAQLEGQVWVDSDSASAVESQFPDNRLPDGVGQPARHDGSGNVVRAAGNVYVYDAENRLVKATAGGFDYYYRYNGEGKRVAVDKKNGTTIVETRLFHYGAGGELLAETAGTLPAAWDRKYVGVDHLGSTRLVMKASGTGEGLVDSRHDYFPFGEEVPERGASYGDAALKVKFTGKERDPETGLDYVGARYMSAAQGRFTSPDAPFADQHPGDPQSWNLYAYGRNNPLRFVDPSGQAVELVGSEEERQKQLKALQDAVGKKAGSYLYSNAEKDKDGNATGRYFVGVLSGGPSGRGPDFGSLNAVAFDLAGLIADKQIAQIHMTDANESFVYNAFSGAQTSLNADVTGRTSPFNAPSPIKVWVLNPDTSYSGLPGYAMNNGQPAGRTIADNLLHELGHAAWQMDLKAGRSVNPRDPYGDNRALKFENDVRRLRGGATRRMH